MTAELIMRLGVHPTRVVGKEIPPPPLHSDLHENGLRIERNVPVRGVIPMSGGDFPLVRPNGVIDFDARYLLEADDGGIIYMQNRGYRWGSPEVMQRLSSSPSLRHTSGLQAA
jgi:hypothetical protein